MKLSQIQLKPARTIAEWNPFRRKPKAAPPQADDPYGLNQPGPDYGEDDDADAWQREADARLARRQAHRQEQERQKQQQSQARRRSKAHARPGFHVHPDHLHGNAKIPRPFIYASDGQMLLGAPRQNHMEMLTSRSEDPKALWDRLQGTAIFGRVGNLDSDDDEVRDTVSFWPSEHQDLTRPALQDLIARGLIDGDSEVHVPGNQSTTVSDYLAGAATADQDPEAVRKAELARKLHLLPSDQKKAAMKELGLGGVQKPNRWRDQMRKTGIPAGSSHHFGTSESLAARLNRVLN